MEETKLTGTLDVSTMALSNYVETIDLQTELTNLEDIYASQDRVEKIEHDVLFHSSYIENLNTTLGNFMVNTHASFANDANAILQLFDADDHLSGYILGTREELISTTRDYNRFKNLAFKVFAIQTVIITFLVMKEFI